MAIFPRETYDDRLCYEHAFNLCRFNWLGDYSYTVLCKNAAYGFFIALCYLLMTPYSVGLALLNIGSAACFALSIKEKVNKYVCAGIYVLLLFNPVTFTSLVMARIYRNAILPASILLLFSGYIGIYLNRKEHLKKQLAWIIVAAISLPFFWYIKEDSIWVVPFIFVISLLVIFNKKDKKSILSGIIKMAVPIAALIVVTLSVSVMNKINYGTFVINERKGGEFAELIGNLMAIDSDNKNEEYWVTKDMLEAAFEVSPTFASLRDIMETDTTFERDNREIPGDHIEWKLKNMIDQIGYYEDAPSTESFIGQMNDELEEAFKDGRLKKDGLIHISKGIRGMTLAQIFIEAGDGLAFIKDIALYDNCGPQDGFKSYGEYNDIRRVETFLATTCHMGNGDYMDKYEVYPKLVGKLITKAYQLLTYPVSILAIVGFVSMLVKLIISIKKKSVKSLDVFLVTLGIILSVWVSTFEYAVFSSFFTPDMIERYTSFYLAGLFPLVSVFKYFSIYFGIKSWKSQEGTD